MEELERLFDIFWPDFLVYSGYILVILANGFTQDTPPSFHFPLLDCTAFTIVHSYKAKVLHDYLAKCYTNYYFLVLITCQTC